MAWHTTHERIAELSCGEIHVLTCILQAVRDRLPVDNLSPEAIRVLERVLANKGN